MNQGGHNRFSECGWFVCFSADSGTQVILDNPVILSKNLYTYDRLGRQLSAIADGVSTNLYAYSRYGHLTNEVVQGLCASVGNVGINKAAKAVCGVLKRLAHLVYGAGSRCLVITC